GSDDMPTWWAVTMSWQEPIADSAFMWGPAASIRTSCGPNWPRSRRAQRLRARDSGRPGDRIQLPSMNPRRELGLRRGLPIDQRGNQRLSECLLSGALGAWAPGATSGAALSAFRVFVLSSV